MKSVNVRCWVARCGKTFGLRRKLFGILFALSLAIALVVGSGVSSLSQVNEPTSREELVHQIEDWAVKDAQVGGMNDAALYDRFENNQFGLGKSEIYEIYRAKFIEETSKTNPIEAWLERVPWWLLPSLSAVIAVALQRWWNTLTSWTNKALDWFYRLVAGNPLFLNLALKKYQQSLAEKHKNLDTPFRITPPLAMAEVYVPLKVKEVSDQEITQVTAQSERDIYRMMVDYKRLMVTGAPGSGKSVLLKHIVHTYGEQGFLDLPGLPIPVRLELNSLREKNLDEAKFISKLVGVLDQNDFPNAAGFIEKYLENGKLLLLLDGLDEVPSSIRDNVVRVINEFLEKYKDCRAIVTCRTAVYQREFDQVLDRNRLEVVEFSDRQIRGFLRAWKSRMPKEKSVDQLMQNLQDRPKIKTLARNPLLLTIIVYLFTETSFVLPHSRAEFYEKATNILLELRDQDKLIAKEVNNYSAKAKRQVLRRLALAAQDRQDPNNPDRRSITWDLVKTEIEQVLPDLNLENSDTEPILEEIIQRSGLLLKIDGGERYQFAHLTLQEFFAAGALENQTSELVERWRKDTVAWREVVKLWCGLVGNSTDLIKQIHQYDELLAFECLAEAQEVDQSLASEITALEKLNILLLKASVSEEHAQAFGSVAADSKPRGQQVFLFLKSQLSAEDSTLQQAAAKSLAVTNLPMAAVALAGQYYYRSHVVREHLIRMGNLAISPLVKMIENINPQLMADLYEIRTPEAAKALVPLLWHGSSQLSTPAAWWLAAFFCMEGVVEELDQVPLEELADYAKNQPTSKSKDYEWVWSPFVEFVEQNSVQRRFIGIKSNFVSPTSVIAGRIVEIILQNPTFRSETKNKENRYFPLPDTRLIFPNLLPRKPKHIPKISAALKEELLDIIKFDYFFSRGLCRL